MTPMPPAPPHGWQVLDRIESLRHSILILPLYPKSVADLIKLTKPDSIPDEAAACVAAGVLAAVTGLFLAGYNHNDIKPGNIMLAANQVTLGTAWAGHLVPPWPLLHDLPLWQVMVANGNCLHRRRRLGLPLGDGNAGSSDGRGSPRGSPLAYLYTCPACLGPGSLPRQAGPRRPERPLARLGPALSTAAAP